LRNNQEEALKGDEDTWEYQRWLIAIEAAASWHDPSEGDFGDTSDRRPLAMLFRAGVPVPQKLRDPWRTCLSVIGSRAAIATSWRLPEMVTTSAPQAAICAIFGYDAAAGTRTRQRIPAARPRNMPRATRRHCPRNPLRRSDTTALQIAYHHGHATVLERAARHQVVELHQNGNSVPLRAREGRPSLDQRNRVASVHQKGNATTNSRRVDIPARIPEDIQKVLGPLGCALHARNRAVRRHCRLEPRNPSGSKSARATARFFKEFAETAQLRTVRV